MSHQGDVQQPSKQEQAPLIKSQQQLETPHQEKINPIDNQVKNDETIFEVKKEEQKTIIIVKQLENKQVQIESNKHQQHINEIEKLDASKHQKIDVQANNLEEQHISKHPIIQSENDKIINQTHAQQNLANFNGRQLLVEQSAASKAQEKLEQNVTNLEIEKIIQKDGKKQEQTLNQLHQVGNKQKDAQNEQQKVKVQIKNIDEKVVDPNQQIQFWPHQKIQVNLKQELNELVEDSERKLENKLEQQQKIQEKQAQKINTLGIVIQNVEEKQAAKQIKDKQEDNNVIQKPHNVGEILHQQKEIESSNKGQGPQEKSLAKEIDLNKQEQMTPQNHEQREDNVEAQMKKEQNIILLNNEKNQNVQEVKQIPKAPQEINEQSKVHEQQHEQVNQQVELNNKIEDHIESHSLQAKKEQSNQQHHQQVKEQNEQKNPDSAECVIEIPKTHDQIKKESNEPDNHHKVVEIDVDNTQEPHQKMTQRQNQSNQHVQEGRNIEQDLMVTPQAQIESEEKIESVQKHHEETSNVLLNCKEHDEVQGKVVQQQKELHLQVEAAVKQQSKEQHIQLKEEPEEHQQHNNGVNAEIKTPNQQSHQLQKHVQVPIKYEQEVIQQVVEPKQNHQINQVEVEALKVQNQQNIIEETYNCLSKVQKKQQEIVQNHQESQVILKTSNEQLEKVKQVEAEQQKYKNDELLEKVQEVKQSHAQVIQKINEPNQHIQDSQKKSINQNEHQQTIVKEEQIKKEVEEIKQNQQEVIIKIEPIVQHQQQTSTHHQQIQKQIQQKSHRNNQQNVPIAEENQIISQTINDNEAKAQLPIQPSPLRQHSLASQHTQFPSGSNQILQFQQFTPSQTKQNKPQQNPIQLPLISFQSNSQNNAPIKEKKQEIVEPVGKVKSVTKIQQQIKASQIPSDMKSNNQLKQHQQTITPKKINQLNESIIVRKQDNKQGVGKIARKNNGQKRVTDVIADIQKFNSFKKPQSGKKVSIRKRTIENPKQNNIVLKSKVLSLTIGQLLSKNQTQQAEKLLGQIDDLKKKLFHLQQKREKAQMLDESPERKQQYKDTLMSNSSQKKLYTGKIYKRSQSINARVPQEVQTSGYIEHFHNSPYTSSAPRRRMSSTQQISGIRSAHRQTQQQNKTGPIIFRVKKNNKSLHGTLDFNSSEKINDYRGKQPQSEEKGFQTRHQPFERLQFTEQERLVAIEKPKPRRISFQEQFQEYVNRFFIDLGQDLPRRDSSQQQLIQIAKNTFRIFGIDIHSQKNTTMSVKKYKNCVSFILDGNRTILWYYQGKFYFGGWKINNSGEGQKNGWGYDYSHGKYVFSGQFKENKRDGYGIMKFLTKQQDLIYEGEWKNGFKEGFGKQKESDGSEYIGNWLQGKRDGKGKIKISQQCFYEGSFSMGVKNGFGKEKFKNGDSFEGHYLNGKFEGTGIYLWINGSRYEGEFKEGSRNGNGVWVSSITEKQYDRYEGQYKDDKKHGYGIYRWKDGTIYEGQFVNDLRHGEGVVTYGEGKSAKLQWFQGSMVTQKDKSRPKRRSITKNTQQQFQTERPKIKFNPGRQGQTRSRPTRISHGLEEI